MMQSNVLRQTNRDLSPFTPLRRQLHNIDREIDALLVCPFISDDDKVVVQQVFSQLIFCRHLLSRL